MDIDKDTIQSPIRNTLERYAFLLPTLLAVLYGYLLTLLLTRTPFSIETLSWSFVMLIPYSVGVISVHLSPSEKQERLSDSLITPMITLGWLVAVLTLFSFGMFFCIIISLPILFPAASLGGLSVWLFRKNNRILLGLILVSFFLPFISGPVEAGFDTPQVTTFTHTSIVIDAAPEVIWDEIASVSPITADEHHFNWVHWVGLPRPVAATLSEHAIGGVRNATFENGLRFDEEITEWEMNHAIGFTIEETSDVVLPPPLHLIDGETFDVLAGRYEIEPMSNGSVRLHLSSEHTLSTHFNWYGQIWTDYTMRNLQNYILEILRERAEDQTG